VRQLSPLHSRILRNCATIALDLVTIVRFRETTLRKYQLLWVKPSEIRYGFALNRPTCGPWLVSLESFRGSRVALPDVRLGLIEVCRRVAIENLSWEDAGEKENLRMLQVARGGGVSLKFSCWFERRYSELDSFLADIRLTGKMKTRRELGADNFRERGGILVGIDGDGEPILLTGHHRFFLAHALRLAKIPVAVTIVTREAVQSGSWLAFRNSHLS